MRRICCNVLPSTFLSLDYSGVKLSFSPCYLLGFLLGNSNLAEGEVNATAAHGRGVSCMLWRVVVVVKGDNVRN